MNLPLIEILLAIVVLCLVVIAHFLNKIYKGTLEQWGLLSEIHNCLSDVDTEIEIIRKILRAKNPP